MKKVILATQNLGKIREFKQIMAHYPFEVMSLLDLADDEAIEETGTTFEENALIKARAIALKYKVTVIADDSGLEIDALDGAPGVYSARYAGKMRSDDANMDKVLTEMVDVPRKDRTARFVCVLAMVDEHGKETVLRGTCEGEIWEKKCGNNGFGYDPIFYLPPFKQTMAQLSNVQKNRISHRADALRRLERIMGMGDDE
ncbi:MAG: XTP/dITP diphosphatase [Defluviitaleaceae bacterium]|nr:XTP/dITP diphosphatase [Defluviitaleaceae bacterium]